MSESEARPGGGSLGRVADPPNRANWSDPVHMGAGTPLAGSPYPGRILVLIALVALAAIVPEAASRPRSVSTKEQAIAIADRQIDFNPSPPRSGCSDKASTESPSGSSPCPDPIGSVTNPRGFTRIVVVQIDANTGSVEDVNNKGCESAEPSEGKEENKSTPTKVEP